jgi:hypothetical protein
MSLSEVLRVSGSNIGPALSATALAMTATLSPVAARADSQLPIFVGQYGQPNSPTDVMFLLGLRPDGKRTFVDTAQRPSQMVSGVDVHAAAKLSLLYPAKGNEYYPFNVIHYDPPTLGPSVHPGDTVRAALEYYDGLPIDSHSEILWDVVSLAFAVGCLSPRVDVVEGMTTVDFSVPGHLLSILIDGDVCHLSAFSRQKELKMTYVIEKGTARDELIDVLWVQLRDFRRPIKA